MGNTPLHIHIAEYIIKKDGNYGGIAKYRKLMSNLIDIGKNRYEIVEIKDSQELYDWILFSVMAKPQLLSCNLLEFMEEYCETNHTYKINHCGDIITIHTRKELNIPYFTAQHRFSGEMTLPDEYTIQDLYLMLISSGESKKLYAPSTLTEEQHAMLDFFGAQ